MIRRTPAVVLVVGALLLTAGCSGVIPGDDGQSAAGPAVDSVPANATAVTFIDVDGLLTAESHHAIADSYLSMIANQSDNYTGPTTADEALSMAENETEIAPTSIDSVTAFSAGEAATAYSAAIVSGSFTASAFVSAQESSQAYNYSETTYAGLSLYEPVNPPAYVQATYIGVLGDGSVVTGSEAAVKDALDVDAGNGDAVAGEARSAFENSRDGLIRFGALVPHDELPTEAANRSVPVDATVYSSVDAVWGAHYVTGDTLGLTVSMDAPSGEAATDIRDVTDGAISLASGSITNESVKDHLRAITVEQDGSTVTITYENSVEALQAVLNLLTAA